MTTPQTAFGDMLEQVTGQAFAAGGYRLIPDAVQQGNGLFRYEKAGERARFAVEFHVLAHQDTPVRFRVMLRRDGLAGQPALRMPLARLLWADYRVRLLSGPDHWWACEGAAALAEALLEAGKLVFGYGIPWLEGTLMAGDSPSE